MKKLWDVMTQIQNTEIVQKRQAKDSSLCTLQIFEGI